MASSGTAAPRTSFELSAFTAAAAVPRIAVRELIDEVHHVVAERRA